jgi:hypothetical protein
MDPWSCHPDRDTWLLRNGHWQIVAAEDLIAPEKGDWREQKL